MEKYKINVKIKNEDGKIVSGNVNFKNLDKLMYSDLDVLIYVLFNTLNDAENKINLVNCDIIHACENGHEELVLRFNDVKSLLKIYYGLNYYCHKEKITTETKKEFVNQMIKDLKKYDLHKYFMMKFTPNK